MKIFQSVLIGILLAALTESLWAFVPGGAVVVTKAPTVEAQLALNRASLERLGATQIQDDWRRFTQERQEEWAKYSEEKAHRQTSFARNVLFYADQATAWINQFNKMATQIRTAMSQLNTTRGLFGIAVAGLNLDEAARKNLKDWFAAYEATLEASQSAKRLWDTRYAMVQAIRRFKDRPSGFNPRELFEVINDYVRRANRERAEEERALRSLIERDPILGALWEQWGDLNIRLEAVNERLAALTAKSRSQTGMGTRVQAPDAPTVTGEPPADPSQGAPAPDTANVSDKELLRQIADQIERLDREKSEIERQLNDLMQKIKLRCEQLQIPLERMAERAQEVAENANAWRRKAAAEDALVEKALRTIFDYEGAD
jgi:uncharacterized protein (UPF0335 family)